MPFRGKVLYEENSESFLKTNIGSPNKAGLTKNLMVKLLLQTKKHLRKQKNFKSYRDRYDWHHPLADEASSAANEASLFGPYIFTKLAPIFFVSFCDF